MGDWCPPSWSGQGDGEAGRASGEVTAVAQAASVTQVGAVEIQRRGIHSVWGAPGRKPEGEGLKREV